ncbi:MAG: VOC family protein [Caldilineaceae bacterium]|nr:VOC family protein [Caldilineaceae bacterium]
MTESLFEISLLKIPVTDIEEASAFYAEDFGLELQFVAAEYGWAQFALGDCGLALYRPGGGGGDGKIGGSLDFHLSLAADSFEALAQRLGAKGCLLGDRIHTGADGTTFVDIADPDGNVLKVFRR